MARSSWWGQSSSPAIPNGNDGLAVRRYNTNGTLDTTFGTNGEADVTLPSVTYNAVLASSQVAIQADGGIVFAADLVTRHSTVTTPQYSYRYTSVETVAVRLTTTGALDSGFGTGDSVQQFGQAGLGKTIPAPGDYDGDGKADVAIYLPATGTLAYRSSSTGKDVLTQFGPAGVGASIPAPGDYDGDGKTDIAVYIPSQGRFAIRPSSGAPSYFAPFGTSGTNASIPAPGDYDGDGKTDLAVYLTATGTLAYRASGTSSSGNDVLFQFGPTGFGTSIPAPGDYDGDGITDIAVYIPSMGDFAVHPGNSVVNSQYPSGTINYLVPFGTRGTNESIPAPGDYDGDGDGDGDGKSDFAVYIPSQGIYAYRSSAGRGDTVQKFGISGVGQTIPASSLPLSQSSGGSGNTSAVGSSVAASWAVYIPLTDDLTNPTPRKKTTTSRVGSA